MAKPKAVRMNTKAAKVFAETAFHTGIGMERAMAGKDFILIAEARDYWLDKHAKSIVKALKRAKADWDQDRKLVLPRAEDLGKIAADLAIADHAGGKPPIQVKKDHVKNASKKVNKDALCRAARIKAKKDGPGGGAYCEGS